MTRFSNAPTFPNSYSNVIYYKGHKYNSIQRLNDVGKMRGAKRVITFCILTVFLPAMLIITPLYLRHTVFADVQYSVAESDVVEIKEGISSVFCEKQSLTMNTTFNAFKLMDKPTISKKRKHIRLKKSMRLPDDTLEYWGFFLLRGATVYLKVCSRYEGARILVVRGERNLKTCGLMEHNLKKYGATMDIESTRVKVTFETAAQEIQDSLEGKKQYIPKSDANTAAEDDADNLNKHTNLKIGKEQKNRTKVVRHSKRKIHKKHEERVSKLQKSLESDQDVNLNREKRETGVLLDGKIEHGGNAMNYTHTSDESVSSFETGLLTCYDGSILVSQGFSPSDLCENVQYLDKTERMHIEHSVASDGYYYYIFYSDNDFVHNDIHAVFDIYKPTYQYSNMTQKMECLNSTTCTFPVSFWSDESVILEVPTRDGIEHEEDDITLLTSTCHPRMAVYVIFPITVMFLVLGCAFI